jgi:nuclear GTP-binding protein
LGKAIKDPYQVVMRQTKLPVSLLNEASKFARVHLLETETFETTFGPKKTRKRPNLINCDLEAYISTAQKSGESYEVDKDKSLVRDAPDSYDLTREWIMKAGLSKRIWGELYKVIDSSDVVIQVLGDCSFTVVSYINSDFFYAGSRRS